MLDAAEIGYRLLGISGGTFIALTAGEPASWTGLVKRGISSTLCGAFLCDPLCEYLQWSTIVPGRLIAASFLSAALGWYIVHMAIRTLQTARIKIPWIS